MPCFQFAAGSGGNLRGNEDRRAGPQRGQAGGDFIQDEGHVSHVVVVHGRVVTHPENIRRREGGGRPARWQRTGGRFAGRSG